MKKIVVSLEGESYRRELLEFAKMLNARSPLMVTGGEHSRIRRYCEENGIACSSRNDPGLLLSGGQLFDDALLSSPCPVLLLPGEARLPGELILVYDGSASSVHAIRQFAGLFPELCRVKTTLVYIGEPDIPDDTFIRELCGQHFRNFRMLKLPVRPDAFYDTWIGMMNSPWLVAGFLGQPLLGNPFAGRMIRDRIPLFLARA